MEMSRGEVGINQGSGVIFVPGELLDSRQRYSGLHQPGAEGMPERVPHHTGKPGSPHSGNEYPPIERASVPGLARVHWGGKHPGRKDDLPSLQFPEGPIRLYRSRAHAGSPPTWTEG